MGAPESEIRVQASNPQPGTPNTGFRVVGFGFRVGGETRVEAGFDPIPEKVKSSAHQAIMG